MVDHICRKFYEKSKELVYEEKYKLKIHSRNYKKIIQIKNIYWIVFALCKINFFVEIKSELYYWKYVLMKYLIL